MGLSEMTTIIAMVTANQKLMTDVLRFNLVLELSLPVQAKAMAGIILIVHDTKYYTSQSLTKVNIISMGQMN